MARIFGEKGGEVLYYFFVTLVPKKNCVIFYPSPPPPIISFWRNVQPLDYSKPPDYSVLESIFRSDIKNINLLTLYFGYCVR